MAVALINRLDADAASWVFVAVGWFQVDEGESKLKKVGFTFGALGPKLIWGKLGRKSEACAGQSAREESSGGHAMLKYKQGCLTKGRLLYTKDGRLSVWHADQLV